MTGLEGIEAVLLHTGEMTPAIVVTGEDWARTI
jgi:hypothetical protein